MKKNEIIKYVSNMSGLTKSNSNKVIKSLIKVIQFSLKHGETISLSGLGSFKTKRCKAKKGRVIKTGEKILIPAGKKISFKPTKTLKKYI
jgi:nucleoid DNA-binding protein